MQACGRLPALGFGGWAEAGEALERFLALSARLTGFPAAAIDPTLAGDLRCHDHPNLLLVGGGAFPTGSTANPTLTTAALALRAVGAVTAPLSP